MSIGEFPIAISSQISSINLSGCFYRTQPISYSSGNSSLQGTAYIYKLFDTSAFTFYFGYYILTSNNFNTNQTFTISAPDIVQKLTQHVDLDPISVNNDTQSFINFRNGYLQFYVAALDLQGQGITML